MKEMSWRFNIYATTSDRLIESWNKFLVVKPYVVLQLMRQLLYSTSGGNNLAPLHLRRTETMLKHRKVSDILSGFVAHDIFSL